MTERLGRLLRWGADFLSPPPPPPLPRVPALTITRSRQKWFDGDEWLQETIDHGDLVPPVRDARLGLNDTLDLVHDVTGWDKDGRKMIVKNTYHLSFRAVQP